MDLRSFRAKAELSTLPEIGTFYFALTDRRGVKRGEGILYLKGYNQVVTKQLEVVYESGVLRPLEPLPFAEKQHLVVTVTDELDPKATFSAREREQEWLRVNGPRHAGKWLAIEGDQLVGEGDNARAVFEQARANGIAHPLLVQIPNDPQL